MDSTSETATATPVGVWKGAVEMPGNTFELELRFTHDGKAVLHAAGGSEGKGTWRATGERSFNFQIIENFPGGRVRINQDAVLLDDTFRSAGTSKVYDAKGIFQQSVNPTVTATRVNGG
ncbi:MAG TPA: hypothetical protein VF755_14950 [Catenuloplanes sp.]|jgi:hypothetical protein